MTKGAKIVAMRMNGCAVAMATAERVVLCYLENELSE